MDLLDTQANKVLKLYRDTKRISTGDLNIKAELAMLTLGWDRLMIMLTFSLSLVVWYRNGF